MEKINILTALVAVVLVVVLIQTIQLTFMSQQKASASGLAVAAQASNTGANQGFSSYEEMMAAHHGGSEQSSSAAGSLPNMVGGC